MSVTPKKEDGTRGASTTREDTKRELRRWARGGPTRLVRDRARTMLRQLNGAPSSEIARALGRSLATIEKWKAATSERGIDAIHVGKSTGRPRSYDWESIDQVATAFRSGLSGREISRTLGISRTTVARILDTAAIEREWERDLRDSLSQLASRACAILSVMIDARSASITVVIGTGSPPQLRRTRLPDRPPHRRALERLSLLPSLISDNPGFNPDEWDPLALHRAVADLETDDPELHVCSVFAFAGLEGLIGRDTVAKRPLVIADLREWTAFSARVFTEMSRQGDDIAKILRSKILARPRSPADNPFVMDWSDWIYDPSIG